MIWLNSVWRNVGTKMAYHKQEQIEKRAAKKCANRRNRRSMKQNKLKEVPADSKYFITYPGRTYKRGHE